LFLGPKKGGKAPIKLQEGFFARINWKKGPSNKKNTRDDKGAVCRKHKHKKKKKSSAGGGRGKKGERFELRGEGFPFLHKKRG